MNLHNYMKSRRVLYVVSFEFRKHLFNNMNSQGIIYVCHFRKDGDKLMWTLLRLNTLWCLSRNRLKENKYTYICSMFSTQSTATKHMCEISLCVCSKYFMKACNTTELYKTRCHVCVCFYSTRSRQIYGEVRGYI